MSPVLHESIYADGSHYAWLFWCPGCRSIHMVDSRWTFNGNVERPTFRASVLVHAEHTIGRPRCHSMVTDGRMEYLPDSTHALAGKWAQIPPWDEGWFELDGENERHFLDSSRPPKHEPVSPYPPPPTPSGGPTMHREEWLALVRSKP